MMVWGALASWAARAARSPRGSGLREGGGPLLAGGLSIGDCPGPVRLWFYDKSASVLCPPSGGRVRFPFRRRLAAELLGLRASGEQGHPGRSGEQDVVTVSGSDRGGI